MKDSPPADALAAQAGVSLRDVARRWPTARVGLKPNEIQNRIASIRRAARHGGLSAHAAERLAHQLRCDPQIFLWGAAYSGVSVGTRRPAPGGPAASATAG
ncbi:MAG TPA: hypothetical protein VF719_04395, partial [Abditibacteriaceae bacterium]